jgi:hypothetical protein
MQNKKFWSTLFVSLIASQTLPAYAIMSIPNGWYLEANGGVNSMSGKSYPGSTSRSAGAANGNIGYKFIPYFALEAGYSYYAETTIKDSAGTKAAFDKHYSFDLAGKGIIPFSDTGFELFAKLGAARISSKVTVKDPTAAASIGIGANSHNTTGIYLGAGGQYYVMPEMAIVLQWQRATGNSNTGTFDLYTAGLNFIFG